MLTVHELGDLARLANLHLGTLSERVTPGAKSYTAIAGYLHGYWLSQTRIYDYFDLIEHLYLVIAD